jgi:hypothetical protein
MENQTVKVYEKENLASEYAQFSLSDELKRIYKNTLGMPLNFAKMMVFANEAKFNNDIIDYWMNFGPARYEDEQFDNYKNRMKFQNALLKYRKYLYDYNQIAQ